MKFSKKIIKNVITIALVLAIGATAVYSWIIGDVAPDVQGNFRLGSDSGLILQIDDTKGNLINLNEYYGISTEKLSLSEVSSVDGVNFYARNYTNYYEDENKNEIITFDVATPINKNNLTGHYLEQTFLLNLSYAEPGSKYYIYFVNGYLSGSPHITGFSKESAATTTVDGLKALRVAMYVDGLKTSGSSGVYDESAYNPVLFDSVAKKPKYAIFANGKSDSEKAVKTTAAYSVSTGSVQVCQKIGTKMYGTEGVPAINTFSDFGLNNGNSNIETHGSELPHNNYLFRLDQNYKTVSITIRVWLEGMSPFCVDGQVVQKDNVNLDLYFVAFRKTEEPAS